MPSLQKAIDWQNQHFAAPTTSLGELEDGWSRAADLFAPSSAALDALLAYYCTAFPGADARAQAAFLVNGYSSYLSIALVAPYLIASTVPGLSPEAVALRLEDVEVMLDGRTVAAKKTFLRFLLPTRGTFSQTPATIDEGAVLQDRFRLGIEAHFAPLVETLWKKTALAPAAQWRLIADSFGWAFLEIGRKLRQEDAAAAEATAILKAESSPLRNRQLCFREVAVQGPGEERVRHRFRSRGGCCRYYTVPGGALCDTCVLVKPAEQENRMRDLLAAEVAAQTLGESR